MSNVLSLLPFDCVNFVNSVVSLRKVETCWNYKDLLIVDRVELFHRQSCVFTEDVLPTLWMVISRMTKVMPVPDATCPGLEMSWTELNVVQWCSVPHRFLGPSWATSAHVLRETASQSGRRTWSIESPVVTKWDEVTWSDMKWQGNGESVWNNEITWTNMN